MREIQVRDLTLADICEGKQFISALNELSPTQLSVDKAKEIYFDRQHAGIRTIVATLDDVIIGTASIFIEQKFIRNAGKVGHIEDVVVVDDYQKTGIGKLLIDELLSYAHTAGCYKVVLNCKKEVAPFYEKLGFRKHEFGMRIEG